MVWRRRWATTWDAVRYCSDRCRRGRAKGLDDAVEAALRDALASAPAGRILDVAAAVAHVRGHDPDLVAEAARDAARRLASAGEASLFAGGRPSDPASARGPLGLRRR